MYEELLERVEPMVRSILKRRKLRVDNFEDFLQEVRVRIYKYGMVEGISEMQAVAGHVIFAHKSFRQPKRVLTEHQIPDTIQLSTDDDGMKMVDIADDIESLVRLTRSSFFTKEERFVFDTMLEGGHTMDEIGKMLNPPTSRQRISQIQHSLIRKIRDLKWTA